MPCVSLLLYLYQTALVTALPPPPPRNVESACNVILGVKGPSNQHRILGGGGMCEFAVFL